MLQVDALKKAGCNTDLGLQRCCDDEAFYLELVENALQQEKYDLLFSQIEHKKWKEAFESSHTLKGLLLNLSLDPLSEIVCLLTEILRPQTETDCTELVSQLKVQLQALQQCV